MSNSSKILTVSIGLGLLLAIGIAFAQEETSTTEMLPEVALDENIQPQDLGISEPRILPDSPFYFLKNLGRELRSLITIDPIKKAELREKFASEKLIEVRKMIRQEKPGEKIEKGLEKYQKEIEKAKMATEKIKETAEQNEKVGAFLDKFIQQQVLHQRILEKLEEQAPVQVFEKIKTARESHLEKFGEVITRLENKESIQERLEKNLEEIKGSDFKSFKNLEILKDLEEKVPEQAKEAIQKAQENVLTRFQGKLEQMTSEQQERFKEYIEKISGEKESQMELLEDLRLKIQEGPLTPKTIQLREKLEQGKTRIFEKIEEKSRTLNCPAWTTPAHGFCKEGKVIIEKDQNGCPLPPRCATEPRKTGEPKQRELFCTMEWIPVCGKDGKTYSNECFARMTGIEIDYKGTCKEVVEEGFYYCQKDDDCACGRRLHTDECFYGNKKYIDENNPCPDFCSGFGGDLIIKCIENRCEQVTK